LHVIVFISLRFPSRSIYTRARASKLAWMVMSMALTVAAARDSGFSIPDRFGHLLGHARRHPHVAFEVAQVTR
jgi:hypothetical protein